MGERHNDRKVHQLKIVSFWLKEAKNMAVFIGTIPVGVLFKFKPARGGMRSPIVLVPGFLGSGLEFYALRRALVSEGFPVYVAPMGFQMGDIDKKRKILKEFLKSEGIIDSIVVGYSLGGWVTAGLDPIQDQVKALVMVAVSYQGTTMAKFLPFFKASFQLMPNSKFIKKEKEILHKREHQFINVTALVDEIARPTKTTALKNPKQEVVIPFVGHLNVVMEGSAISELLKVIKSIDSN